MSTPDTNTTDTPERKDILLRAAFDLIRRGQMARFVASPQSLYVRYDESDCDGGALLEDIAIELGIEPDTKPIPLED